MKKNLIVTYLILYYLKERYYYNKNNLEINLNHLKAKK